MSLFDVMSISTTGMSAENIRLNTIASNVANANSISSSVEETYRARYPVFAAELERANQQQQFEGSGVKVLGIVESDAPLNIEYNPGHSLADENGYIYRPNVNVVEESANLLSASKAYETNVQVADTTKRLFRRVLQLGQGR
jgi:flagellar basal-body rod protein FlgC